MATVQLLLHDMDADQTPNEELDALLTVEERMRAARFFAAAHGRRCRVGRGPLRRTLAKWTGVPAADVTLQYGRAGEPERANGPAFNVSHSEGLVLIGATPAAEQNAAFLRVWTRKEALIKAAGDGLSISLKSFCVSPNAGTGNALRSAGGMLGGGDCDCAWAPALR